MTGHVWGSNTQVSFEPTFGLSPVSYDGTPDDLGNLSSDIRFGIRIDPKVLPTKFVQLQGRDQKKLPDFFYNTFYFMSEVVAEIFRRFDLGKGYLHPVEIMRKDSKESYGTYYILVAGNEKKAFSPDHSRNTREIAPGWFSLYPRPANDDIAMTPTALEGPDIWHQRGVRGLYLSKALKDALESCEVHELFHLYRVRIVGVADNNACETIRNTAR